MTSPPCPDLRQEKTVPWLWAESTQAWTHCWSTEEARPGPKWSGSCWIRRWSKWGPTLPYLFRYTQTRGQNNRQTSQYLRWYDLFDPSKCNCNLIKGPLSIVLQKVYPSIIMYSMSRSVDVVYLWEPVVQSWGWWHCPEAQCWCQALGCCWWETWGLD